MTKAPLRLENLFDSPKLLYRILGSVAATAFVVSGRQSYDIVFMDIQMPEVDGLEATILIRPSETLTQPHIIAMTANVMREDRNRCMNAGMDDFVAKPIRLDCLIEALERAPGPG